MRSVEAWSYDFLRCLLLDPAFLNTNPSLLAAYSIFISLELHELYFVKSFPDLGSQYSR